MSVPGESIAKHIAFEGPKAKELIESEDRERLNLGIEPIQRDLGDLTLRMTVLHPGESNENITEDRPEFFSSIQGEGRNIDVPVTFMRLSDCLLTCSFCDVASSWAFTKNKAAKHDDNIIYDKEKEQTYVSIEDAAAELISRPDQHTVISGGEPMLQQKQIMALIDLVRETQPEHKFEIETSATVRLNERLIEQLDQINTSPKLANSGNTLRQRRRPAILKQFAECPKVDFKFVITAQEDMDEVLELVNTFKIPNDRVFLMPEGRTVEQLKVHEEMVRDMVKKYNFIYTGRKHIELYGDKKGV